jgi:hypothetical protein
MTTYPAQSWLDGVAGNTPLSAARLNYMEQGISAASATAYLAAALPLPTDYGYAAWSSDPASIHSTITLTTGVLYLQRIPIRTPGTVISAVHFGLASTGTLTSGQNFTALYDATGALLSSSADLTSAMAATGEVVGTLAAPQTIAGIGFVYAAVLINGSAMPTVSRGGPLTSGVGNAKTTATTKRFAQYGTAQTAIPTPLTLTSMANTATPPWMALS